MEAKRKHRKVLRATFTKKANELETLLAASELDILGIKVLLGALQEKHGELKVVNEQIYEAMLAEDATEEALLEEMEGSDAYNNRFIVLNVKYDDVLHKLDIIEQTVHSGGNNSQQGSTNSVIQGKRKFKLPTIEFKKFDGNIKNWLPFWSQFKKVHEDSTIDDEDKVEYLIQATLTGTRARDLVESFPRTGANYSKIVDCMLSRFGREDLQIEVRVRELLKLILTNAVSGNKIELYTLYDNIETQLRSLETLGVTSDKCSALLFPLIESCLPEEVLRAWQRSSFMNKPVSDQSLEDRLKSLMQFLKCEVDSEQRITLAAEGFGLHEPSSVLEKVNKQKSKGVKFGQSGVPTASSLISCEASKCVFCDGGHGSAECYKAQKMSYEAKLKVLGDKRACYRCLKVGHQARRCKGRQKCVICSKSHVVVICPGLSNCKASNVTEHGKQDETTHNERSEKPGYSDQVLTVSSLCTTHVFLQTLRVRMNGPTGPRLVRVLIDTGSQKTYVLRNTAKLMGYPIKRQECIIHCLFGGGQMQRQHDCFDVRLSSGDYGCTFEALDQPVICAEVSPISHGPWMEELRSLNIQISDQGDTAPIEVLIGADIAGKLYTGKKHILSCGIVAVETLLGWCLMGKLPNKIPSSDTVTSCLSLLINDSTVSNLWELDTLGIRDPVERKGQEELAQQAKIFFLKTVTQDKEGRYEVRLPWLEGHPQLPDNFQLAKKRLEKTAFKLKTTGHLMSYQQVFEEWQNEGIIEEVADQEMPQQVHYLPHRPVIKENSSTKIRPVFDASARERNKPSLNDCLEKGLNLIELIPSSLLKFRMLKIGVVSDIRKAFLQIGVNEADRDSLRFLWKEESDKLKIYRHRRVVFGVNCSPFLLGATLEYHFSKCLKQAEAEDVPYSVDTIKKLMKSFYVDNCVASVPDEDTLEAFVNEATVVLREGKFDLRGWEHTGLQDKKVPVLGLEWNPGEDTLSLNSEVLQTAALDTGQAVTKRLILSVAQRVFDPIGFSVPVILIPKLLLQKVWRSKLSWDKPVDYETRESFQKWVKDLAQLSLVKIPRWLGLDNNGQKQFTIHTFCDASKDAYAAVCFVRVEEGSRVVVHLLTAKARVAPLKKLTIPRLELMAAVIGARLFKSMVEDIGKDKKCYFWSDSSTVISWIQSRENWKTFVHNRVEEIRSLTSLETWRHTPGSLNPADLPSRGCTAKQLLESKWWEGPAWLYDHEDEWPQAVVPLNEQEVNAEKRKSVKTLLSIDLDEWHLLYFSKYIRVVRQIAWVFRFIYNVKVKKDARRSGELSAKEVEEAETFVLKSIQFISFSGVHDERFRTLKVFCDENGLIRLESRVSLRADTEDFRYPVILPGNQLIVDRLIEYEHRKACHVGTQGLLSLLRERYWILGGRKTVRSVVMKCVVCKRYNAKRTETIIPPLPLNRVRDAAVFEVIGVDLAGPLHLRTREKVWICLFTCGIYRAVHLELVTSLSTSCFLQAFRRFIARRGRPKIVYSDNGTNFVGTDSAFRDVDWEEIVKYASIERIRWLFNPPTASWWGGFFERLVGLVKQLLRKVLGRASLTYEELLTVLCDCESVVNARPLTYLTNDASDLVPLTPAMFLRESSSGNVMDFDEVDRNFLSRRAAYRCKLLKDLRSRFRIEYLGQLAHRSGKIKSSPLSVGDMVLIGNDHDKRLDWPIGRVAELFPGVDGVVRVAKVTTSRGQLLRPVQRLYLLECDKGKGADDPAELVFSEKQRMDVLSESSDHVDTAEKPIADLKVTRRGRVVVMPKRYL